MMRTLWHKWEQDHNSDSGAPVCVLTLSRGIPDDGIQYRAGAGWHAGPPACPEWAYGATVAADNGTHGYAYVGGGIGWAADGAGADYASRESLPLDWGTAVALGRGFLSRTNDNAYAVLTPIPTAPATLAPPALVAFYGPRS